MISGTALFLGLFNNLAIFIVLVFVYGALNSYLEQSQKLTRQIVMGFIFGLFAIACMYVKIPVAEGVIVDQRNTIVFLSGVFGGPLAAFICAAMTGSYRVYLGGGGAFGGVIGVCLSAAAGVVLYKMRSQIDSFFRVIISALAATIIILPGFLFIGDLQAGWDLLKDMALPYGSAIFLGILLVGLLLAHEEYRHNAENALESSEKRFRELFENLIDVSYRTDKNGNFNIISPSSEKIFGYRPEEVIGRQIVDFYKNPSRRDDFMAQIFRDGRVRNFEAEIRKKDGSFVWVSTNAKLISDKDGSFAGIEGVTRDISLIKASEEEKRKLEERLQQSQKMEAIGTLAGGIAHDFNNILAAIIGYAEMVEDEIDKDSPSYEYIEEVLHAGMRARELVRHILTFSRKTEGDYEPVQIHLIVKEVIQLLRASIPSTIEIRQDINNQSGIVMANPTELHQVVMNLCTNAAQEMEEQGGILSITLENLDFTEDSLKNIPVLKHGEYVKLSVNDTGQGISQNDIERIFDPYFTTKEVGSGSGLGLAVVHGIVQSHSGMITVKSKPGEGTTFDVFLPKDEVTASQEIIENDPLPTGNERILVIDDELAVANVTKARLKRLGYQVTAITSSLEALELFRAQPDAFDLVITDQTMPDMTGERLAKEFIDLRPDILIILCSGYSSIVDAEISKGLGIRKFIMKPINLRELAVSVRSVLDAKSLS